MGDLFCMCFTAKRFQTNSYFSSNDIFRLYKKKNYNIWLDVKKIPDIELVDIDSYEIDYVTFVNYINDVPNFIYDSIAYNNHLERIDILSSLSLFANQVNDLIIFSSKSVSALNDIFYRFNIKNFICYSGLIENTPTLLIHANKLNVKTFCVEGWAWRPGHVIYNLNKPALEYNIDGWIKYYGWDKNKEKEIDDYIKFQEKKEILNRNSWLTKFYNVQVTKVGLIRQKSLKEFIKKYPKSFLLAPNVVGDSSTLNRETIFSSQKEWISDVITYFKNHPDLSLIIRAHPAEVWVKSKVKIKLGEYSLQSCKNINNIYVIDSSDDINTFSLIPFIRCGLIWLSSVGVDLVVRNIPIICAASTKYDNLGLMKIPKNKNDYFRLIEDKSKSIDISTTRNQKLNAKKYLYTVFKGFSFPVQADNFDASKLVLNSTNREFKHDLFYSIISGEVTPPDTM